MAVGLFFSSLFFFSSFSFFFVSFFFSFFSRTSGPAACTETTNGGFVFFFFFFRSGRRHCDFSPLSRVRELGFDVLRFLRATFFDYAHSLVLVRGVSVWKISIVDGFGVPTSIIITYLVRCDVTFLEIPIRLNREREREIALRSDEIQIARLSLASRAGFEVIFATVSRCLWSR